MATFIRGDIHEVIQKVPSSSVQLILWNPPFGTTRNSWDECLRWKELLRECFRVLKPEGMLVIHCSVPFNYELIRAADKPPSYSWYWRKEHATCPLLSNYQPMRIVEEVLVWKNKKNTYYKQNIGTEKRMSNYGGKSSYYGKLTKTGSHEVIGRCPTNLLEFPRHIDGFSTRSEEMVEFFLKTYTKEGDLVFDPTCYEGLSGKVARRLGRKWLGCDKHFMPKKLMEPNKN